MMPANVPRTPVLLLAIILLAFTSSPALGKKAEINSGNVQSVKLKPGGLKAVIQGWSKTPIDRKAIEDLGDAGTSDDPEFSDELLQVLTDDDLFDKSGSPGSPACFDLVLILDVSCSILLSTKEHARDFAANLVSRLASIPGTDIKVGLMLFCKGTQHVFYLDDGLEVEELVNAIRGADVEGECKSHLHTALKHLHETYFTVEKGDRDNSKYPNVAMMFTDGRTAQFKYNNDTLAQAMAVKEAGIEINIMVTPHRRGLPDTGEFQALPSKPYADHFFKIENEDEEDRVFETLTSHYSCNGPADQQVCADIVFSFDTSCSIDATNITAAVDIAKGISMNLALDSSKGSRISGFSYNVDVVDSFDFSSGEPDGNPANVVKLLSDLKAVRDAVDGCRTRTDIAFNKTIATLATPNDRDDKIYRDVAIFFGDGRTYPMRYRKATIRAAKSIRDNGGVVIWIVLTSNRGLFKIIDGIENEIENVVSEDPFTGEKLIFYHDDPFATRRILGFLDQAAGCL
ncbi:unnamed protein product [Owenia fusiformis]|uniref:Uncharacterized protein n=1 Tax=Owenia fusiformis TaxID=6347 RepID=A0A8J1TFF7_OWEFU|nr:unnamed protein product [Owenia fusiformis]